MTTTTHQSIEAFEHTRKFGIELEFFGITHEDVKSILQSNGIQSYIESDYADCGECVCGDADCENYNCPTPVNAWKITDDGSINPNDWDDDYGVEIVSPIMTGRGGLREVEKVVRLLSRAGARVNKSCGFHVHVNANDLSGRTLANTLQRYAHHETAIDALMVHSRRANRNEFCRSLVSLVGHFQNVTPRSSANAVAELANERWSSHGHSVGGRYYKLNLCAFFRHGTIEFRQHGGTMNAQKVINWIVFCVNFIETSIESNSCEPFQGLSPSVIQHFNNRVRPAA